MITTLETLELIDQSEIIANMINHSELADEYRTAANSLENDSEAQVIIDSFLELKDSYEEVMRFGKYHPDYLPVRREMRKRKMALDLNDSVVRFRRAEADIQNLLDEISVLLGETVSETIKVPTGNPFFDKGGCSSGGGCGSSCGSH